jgi:hypothetical protein
MITFVFCRKACARHSDSQPEDTALIWCVREERTRVGDSILSAKFIDWFRW